MGQRRGKSYVKGTPVMGLRTLGTGIRQYNGLANQSFFRLHSNVHGLQAGYMWQNRVNGVSFGSFSSPLCSRINAAARRRLRQSKEFKW
jgi:hypothetical protein